MRGDFIKRNFIALFLASVFLCSQFLGIRETAADAGNNSLTIKHVAKVPNSREYTFGLETINNITDIYYYNTSQSPVAKKILSSGFELLNPKNSKIEADIVANGGEITLEYVPKVQDVNVTYFKTSNGEKKEVGKITDKAYVGEVYRALPPLHDEEVLSSAIEIVDNPEHIVGLGENNFSVLYTVKDAVTEIAETENIGQNLGISQSEGKGALLSNLVINKDRQYIFGYPDKSFRPDKKLSKREMLYMMGSLSNAKSDKEDLTNLDKDVSWSEFYAMVNKKLNPGSTKNSYWANFFQTDGLITRAEAVAAINEMQGRKMPETALLPEKEFTDVYEDHWAYKEILKASR